jgi:energy-coupling factor transporter ATP-binding protein EcfA2
MNSFKDADKFIIETGEKIAVLGKTCSGKSTFVRNLIKYRDITFREPVTKIIYVYQYPQEWFEELRDEVDFVTEIPDHIPASGHTILVLDDAIEKDFEEVSKWFLRTARHSKTSLIFIYQCIFNSTNDAFKRIINNTDIFIFCYMPKGKYHLSILFRQFFGNKQQVQDALELYTESMKIKYNYLLFDVRQSVKFQFRQNIFCEHGPFEEIVKI